MLSKSRTTSTSQKPEGRKSFFPLYFPQRGYEMFPTTRSLVTESSFHNKLTLGCNSPAPFLPHMQMTQQEVPKSPSHSPARDTNHPPPVPSLHIIQMQPERKPRPGGFRQLPAVTLGWDGARQHRAAAPGHRETGQGFGESKLHPRSSASQTAGLERCPPGTQRDRPHGAPREAAWSIRRSVCHGWVKPIRGGSAQQG